MDLPDLFPGFASQTFHSSEARIFARIGGNENAPPVVLLHGFPQTHVMWAGIAGELAKDFRVVIPDLRGYGWSQVVEPLPDHDQMSKRAMGSDIVELMEQLGHAQFALVGHDRGGRAAYRLALDHPGRLSKLAVLDIVPTINTWEAMDAAFAMDCYHWFFLAQPSPLPETLIGTAPVAYLDHTLASWTAAKNLSAFSPGALAHYRAAFSVPDRIAALCEDYRAGWGLDRARDQADREKGNKIKCPMLALWGSVGLPAGAVDIGTTPLSVWKNWADHVEGEPITAGHFLVEENPSATLEALRRFLRKP
jgi:haloacetate dehalogenase